MSTVSESEWLGVDDLAAWLGVKPAVVYHLNYTGEAPPRYRIGAYVRYRRSEVEAWLESRRVEPANAS